jgi:hypothetical protein
MRLWQNNYVYNVMFIILQLNHLTVKLNLNNMLL